MRLNAGIVILPLHSPLAVAEEFATLDVMSGGKMILGVALGYRELEFKAFGAALKDRVRRFEDNLIAIKRLWTEDEVHMKGGHFELDGASCLPKPLQQPHPPIWIGANADLAEDRFLIGSPDEVAEQIIAINRRLGVNHLVMSMEWAGMAESLATETMDMFASEVIPRVRAGL